MPFSETCFNELAWAFFCANFNPQCAMQQPKLAFMPHHYATKTRVFCAKSCTFADVGHQCVSQSRRRSPLISTTI